jgi:hypothetical protein
LGITYDEQDDPGEHVGPLLAAFESLRTAFVDDEDACEAIDDAVANLEYLRDELSERYHGGGEYEADYHGGGSVGSDYSGIFSDVDA